MVCAAYLKKHSGSSVSPPQVPAWKASLFLQPSIVFIPEKTHIPKRPPGFEPTSKKLKTCRGLNVILRNMSF